MKCGNIEYSLVQKYITVFRLYEKVTKTISECLRPQWKITSSCFPHIKLCCSCIQSVQLPLLDKTVQHNMQTGRHLSLSLSLSHTHTHTHTKARKSLCLPTLFCLIWGTLSHDVKPVCYYVNKFKNYSCTQSLYA